MTVLSRYLSSHVIFSAELIIILIPRSSFAYIITPMGYKKTGYGKSEREKNVFLSSVSGSESQLRNAEMAAGQRRDNDKSWDGPKDNLPIQWVNNELVINGS